ncbi:hypothetical protein G6F56_006437 [Rhizopus delemar]|nr:hypothetical protein G6F56_006437 [Rhizopus delemar]
MPRTERKARPNKKRGKKGGKKEEVEAMEDVQQLEQQPEIQQKDQHFQAAHFGELDEEMLGYFKNVEQTLDDPPFETGEGNVKNSTSS